MALLTATQNLLFQHLLLFCFFLTFLCFGMIANSDFLACYIT